MTLRFALCTAAVLLAPAFAPAGAPLADRLPADCLIYAGWAGRTEAFGESQFGRLVESKPVQGGFAALHEVLVRDMGRRDGPVFDHFWQMLALAWKHPIAGAVLDVEKPEGHDLGLRLALLIDLGEDKPAFARHLGALVRSADEDAEAQAYGGVDYHCFGDPDETVVSVGFKDQMFFLFLGDAETPRKWIDLKPGHSLAGSDAFAAAIRDLEGDEAQYVSYISVEEAKASVLALAGEGGGDPEGRETRAASELERLVRAFGLENATAVASSMCFEDGQIHSRMRILSPVPHGGMLARVGERTVTAADLAAIPADADFFAISSVSPESLTAEIRRICAVAGEDAEADFDEDMAEFREATGVDLQEDLLAGLGETWTLCSAESQGGFLTGTAVWTEVRDREKLEASLPKLEQALMRALGVAQAPPTTRPATSRRSTTRPHQRHWTTTRPSWGAPAPDWYEIRTMAVGDTRIHFLAGQTPDMPLPVAPAWAIHDGKFYLAAWPQVIASIIEGGPGEGPGRAPSLLDSEEFAALRERLADRPAILTYTNTPRIVRRLYPLALAGGTMGVNAAGDLIRSAEMSWLPSAQAAERFFGPRLSAISLDERGLLYEQYATLPGGAGLFSPETAAAPLAGVAVMPALSHARKLMKRSSSGVNLHSIGIAITIYQAEYEDRYPPNLAVLIEARTLSAETFDSPSGDTPPPRYMDGELVGPVDYVYFSEFSQVPGDPPGGIMIAYEKPEMNDGEGTNILTSHYSVQWVSMERFERELQKTRAYLKEQGLR